MPSNYIALIFPEYDDKDNSTTSQDWRRSALPDDKTLYEFIRQFCAYVDFYSDEDCKMIYDAINASAFIYPINIMSDFYPSSERFFKRHLLKLEDWRKNRVSSEREEYNTTEDVIINEMRSEIACRMKLNPNDSYLLAVHIPNYVDRDWTLIKDSISYKIESQRLSIAKTFDWLATHRVIQRIYNWNPKHGEYGRGAHQKHKGSEVSLLLCSKEHADEIMHFAVGLPMYDTLYYYDAMYNAFMEYKAECKFEHIPQNATTRKYHSYHITDDSLVPKRIKDKLSILERSRIEDS